MLPIVPATLTVLTGYAGQGKTSLTVAIVASLLSHNIPVTIGTFETMPRPILERKLRAALLETAESSLDSIDPKRLAQADELIADNLAIIAQMVGEDEEMSLDDVLEFARIAAVRDGCKVLILDPWNEIEHKRRRDESETEYVNRAIRAIKHFMRAYNVAVWIVAHPAKPDGGNTKLGIPGLYSISGSAAWANKADYGVVYTRPDKETPARDRQREGQDLAASNGSAWRSHAEGLIAIADGTVRVREPRTDHRADPPGRRIRHVSGDPAERPQDHPRRPRHRHGQAEAQPQAPV
jgi:twinkle protein